MLRPFLWSIRHNVVVHRFFIIHKLVVNVLINYLHTLNWLASHITYVLPTTEAFQQTTDMYYILHIHYTHCSYITPSHIRITSNLCLKPSATAILWVRLANCRLEKFKCATRVRNVYISKFVIHVFFKFMQFEFSSISLSRDFSSRCADRIRIHKTDRSELLRIVHL